MRTKPSSSMNLAVHYIDNEAWYMKKVSGSRVTKSLMAARHATKQRTMEDILGLPPLRWKKSHKQRRLIDTGGFCIDDESNALAQTSLPITQMSKGNGEDLEDVENMTLQEMQSFLRKGKNNLLHKTTPPTVCNQVCPNDGLSSPKSDTPFIGLELLWEESTSNSADTSDSGSVVGNSSSCDTPRDMHHLSACVSTDGHVAKEKERGFTDSPAIACADVDENEGWTLQKWQQTYHRRHFCHQRSRKNSESNDKITQNGPFKGNSVLQPGTAQADCLQGRSAAEMCEVSIGIFGPNSSASREVDRGIFSSSEMRSTFEGASSGVSCHSSVRDESDMATSTTLEPERLQMGHSTWALKGCIKVSTSSASTQSKVVFKPFVEYPQNKVHESANVEAIKANARMCRQETDSKVIEVNAAFEAAGCQEAASLKNSHNTKGAHISRSTRKELECCLSKASVEAHNPDDTVMSCVPHSEQWGGLKQSGSYGTHVSTMECEALCVLNAMDSFEIEEECQLKPAKIPCKRKAISPLSQELLLKASRLGEFGSNQEKAGMNWSPDVLKDCSAVMDSNKCWVNVSKRKTMELDGDTLAITTKKAAWEDDASNSLPCHIRQKPMMSRALKSLKGPNLSEPMPTDARKISLALNSSPFPLQSSDKPRDEALPSQTSPPIPAKGILKSLSQGCKGPCCCEECMSVRARAERAAEFSQRQMQDIEGLAVKLMKDLSILRGIVEDRVIHSPSTKLHSPSIKHQGPRPALSIEQLKKATVNALETEERTKKWLVRMARDCNRYCKIMRMQERKLSFADELGGMLCHVKVFHSEPKSDSSEDNKLSSSAKQEPASVSLQERK